MRLDGRRLWQRESAVTALERERDNDDSQCPREPNQTAAACADRQNQQYREARRPQDTAEEAGGIRRCYRCRIDGHRGDCTAGAGRHGGWGEGGSGAGRQAVG